MLQEDGVNITQSNKTARHWRFWREQPPDLAQINWRLD